jgi:hypothetical protein
MALRGLGAADRHQVGLDVAVDLGGDRRDEPGLPAQGGGFTIGDEILADPGHGVDVHTQGLGDPLVAASAVRVGDVGVE